MSFRQFHALRSQIAENGKAQECWVNVCVLTILRSGFSGLLMTCEAIKLGAKVDTYHQRHLTEVIRLGFGLPVAISSSQPRWRELKREPETSVQASSQPIGFTICFHF